MMTGQNVFSASEPQHEIIEQVSTAERNDGLIRKLSSLWEESVRATHHFLKENDIENLKPYVKEGLKNIRHLYVAGRIDSPVGFIGIQDNKIEMLFISPRHHRQGIGKTLVDIAINNHQAIFVDVNEQNPQALAFYEKMGFTAFNRTETDSQGDPFPIIEMAQKRFCLQTDRLVLRPLHICDMEALHSFMSRKEVMYAWEHGFSEEDVRNWIKRQLERYSKDGIGYLAVILKERGQLIGQAGLMKTTMNGNEVVEIGYIFDNAYWHKGYATEAAGHLASHAFTDLGLTAVYCSIRPENKASIRVAERLGMKPYDGHIVVYRGKEMPHLIYKSNIRQSPIASSCATPPDFQVRG